jgi:subtilisin family serine protease
MSTAIRATLAGLALALFTSAAAHAQGHVPGELLVRWKAGSRAPARLEALAPLGARTLATFDVPGLERLRVDGTSVEEAVLRLSRDPRVEYAEPNFLWSIDRVPNDPFYAELYGLHNAGQTGGTPGADIRAEPAWDRFTGDPDLLVGILDTGAQLDHPDLAPNLWTNPGEVPGNGQDDDGNGWVDDVHGYDFLNHDGDPSDDNGHGTHTAGTLAAAGDNGIGVTGVVWRARLVVLKFLGAGGTGPTSAAVEAIDYSIRLGVRLTNNSWGGALYSRALEEAIDRAQAAGQLFVAAAGNARTNTDDSPQYPAALPQDCIVSVAATDAADQLAAFSNYGSTSVDLAAPGVDVLSTFTRGTYQYLSGTSMAAPHVTGAAAFLLGRFPGMSAEDVKARLLGLVDPLVGLAGRCVSGGRLNLALASSDPDSVAPGAITDLAVTAPGSNSVDLSWTATGDDGGEGTAARYELRVGLEPLDPDNFAAAARFPAPPPAPAGTPQAWRLRGLALNSTYWFALVPRDEFGNAGPLSNVVSATTLGPPSLAIDPVSVSAAANTGSVVLRAVELHNDSPGTLEWTAPPPTLEFGAAQAPWPAQTGAKGEDGPARDPVAESSGGPDAFGCRWMDSDEPGGPVFQWVDIAAGGNAVALSGDEAVSAPLDIGFSFPFYGRRFTRVRACTNGYLQFGPEGPAFVNSGLPSTGGPRDMIAPFWDDLHLGAGTDRVFLRSDGTRCVISWVEAPRYNDPTSVMTFQCILYPSGEIRYQYRTMAGHTSSATVGIQDSSRTVGLTVAFNQPYVHDGLAVRLAPIPQWLTVSPASGFLDPGGRQTLNLRLDAAGLASGSYRGHVRLITNAPDAADTSVTATLDVTGAPHLVLAPESLDFGTHFLGTGDTLSLTLANDGVDPLVVTGLTSDSPAFTVASAGFTLLPGDALTRPVTFTPAAIAEHRGALRVTSNDPARPLAELPLHGVASAAPEIEPGAPSLRASATAALHPEAARQERLLVVRNSGGSPLVWSASAYQGLTVAAPPSAPGPRAPREPSPVVAQVKGEVAPGPGALGDGGPDAFGYRWVDSDDPRGPAFAWEEIAAVGTRLFGSADDSSATLALPFPFPFYGVTYGEVHVCTNGFVSFTGRESALVNTDLPSSAAGVPRVLVAPLWTDLDLRTARGAGRAYAHFDGSKLIVEWKDAVHFSGAGPYTFQLLLWPSGTIEFQYLSAGPPGIPATTGIQDSSGTVGLRIAFNAPYARPGLRVRVSAQDDWLTLDRSNGVTPPGGADTLRVRFDARQLADGDHLGEVRLASNDVEQPLLAVPCALHVGLRSGAGEAQPGEVASVSREPLVRFRVALPAAGDAVRPGTLRVEGVPVEPASEPASSGDGRLEIAFRSVDLLANLPEGSGAEVALTGEFESAGWFEARTPLLLRAPRMEAGGLPAFGSGGTPPEIRTGDELELTWTPPAGGADDYAVTFSADGGVRWRELGVTSEPAFTFALRETTSHALVEVVARRGDTVPGSWLSAPFGVSAGEPPPPARLALRRAGENPARGPVPLELSLPAGGTVRVELLDVSGARVRTLLRGSLPAGRHPIVWDGRTVAGTAAPPGIYVAYVRAPGGEASARIALLR